MLTWANTKIDKQRPREKNRCRSHQRPRKIVRREKRSCVFRVRERQIKEDALDDEERATDRQPEADGRCNPVD